jgi:hypothetical protein
MTLTAHPAPTITRHVRDLRDLAADVLALLPIAEEVQECRSPQPFRPLRERQVTGGHSDPTAETALDEGRLTVRRCLARTERDLEDAVVALRGVRLGLERALAIVAEESTVSSPPIA